MESRECPKAMMIITSGNCSQNGPFEPALGVVGEHEVGGNRRRRKLPLVLEQPCVMGHQISRIATITVVICMIRSALPLDSCTPLMFIHQK